MSEKVQKANTAQKNTMMEALGIQITSIEEGRVVGTMPVDHRTHQPMGLLHGGASAALAETLGSFGSHLLIDPNTEASVGVELNINHLNGMRSGIVTGTANIIKRGRTLHVWQIDLADQENKPIATSRLTVMVKKMAPR